MRLLLGRYSTAAPSSRHPISPRSIGKPAFHSKSALAAVAAKGSNMADRMRVAAATDTARKTTHATTTASSVSAQQAPRYTRLDCSRVSEVGPSHAR